MKSFQGLFIRGDTHVVVKFVRITTKDRLSPGDVIKPGDYGTHYRRSLFRRRAIGKQGSPWVEDVLSIMEQKLAKQKERALEKEKEVSNTETEETEAELKEPKPKAKSKKKAPKPKAKTKVLVEAQPVKKPWEKDG